MSTSSAVANVSEQTVAYEGTTYDIRPLAADSFTVLIAGVPVGRIVYTFGAANGVSESESVSEATLDAVAEAWFAAVDG
jgi:hypothetical protein